MASYSPLGLVIPNTRTQPLPGGNITVGRERRRQTGVQVEATAAQPSVAQDSWVSQTNPPPTPVLRTIELPPVEVQEQEPIYPTSTPRSIFERFLDDPESRPPTPPLVTDYSSSDNEDDEENKLGPWGMQPQVPTTELVSGLKLIPD
jgi:hypothetical protein